MPEESFTLMALPEPWAKEDHTQTFPLPCKFGHCPSVSAGAWDASGHSLEKSANFRFCDSHHAKALHQFIDFPLIQNVVPLFAVIVDPPLHVGSAIADGAKNTHKHKNTINFLIFVSFLLPSAVETDDWKLEPTYIR